MRRFPLTLRALVLLPLLAVLTDHTRAAVLCEPAAQSCLEAAGQGWYAGAGMIALAVYGVGLALLVARLAGSSPGLGRLWALSTGAIWASCGAQAARGLAARRGLRARRRLARAAGARRRRRRRARARAAGRPEARPRAAARRTAPDSFSAVASRPLQRSWMGTSAARLRLTRGRAPPVVA